MFVKCNQNRNNCLYLMTLMCMEYQSLILCCLCLQSKPCDSESAAKKSKNIELVQKASNVEQSTLNPEMAESLSKNNKIQKSDIKPQNKAGGVILTRSRRSAAVVDASQNKNIKTSSVSFKPCITKDCKHIIESLMSDEPYQEYVKCEPIIEFGHSDQAESLPPNAAITKIDTVLESSVITPCAKLCPHIESSSGNGEKDCEKSEIDLDKDCEKSEIDLNSLCCSEYSHHSGVNTLSCFSCSSPACSGCQFVVTTLDSSQKTDLSDTRSNFSTFADNCEYKDSINDTLVDDSGRQEVLKCEIDYLTMSQRDFLAIFGLVNKSDLPPPSSSLSNRLHREAGGKLRRCIKSYREPQMVYRRTNVKDLCVVDRTKAISCDLLLMNSAGHSKMDAQKVVYGLRKVTTSRSRFSQFAAKKVKIGKHDSPAKLPSVECVAVESDASCKNSTDSTTHDLTLLADAALANGALKHLDCDKSPKSNNFSPSKGEFKKPQQVNFVHFVWGEPIDVLQCLRICV